MHAADEGADFPIVGTGIHKDCAADTSRYANGELQPREPMIGSQFADGAEEAASRSGNSGPIHLNVGEVVGHLNYQAVIPALLTRTFVP